MTKEYLISANNIADMDRYTNEYLPQAGETLTRYDAEPHSSKSSPTADWLETMRDGDYSCDCVEVDRS